MENKPLQHQTKPNTYFGNRGQWQLFLWFFLTVLLLECIVRLVTPTPFWGGGLLFVILFGLSLAALLTAVCTLFPQKPGFIVSAVFMGIITTVYLVQLYYYFMFNTFLTLFSVINGMEALQFGGNIWATFKRTWPIALATLAPFILFLCFARRLRLYRSFKAAVLAAVLGVALQLIAVIGLSSFGTGFFTPYDYYYNNTSLNQSVEKLGLYTTFRQDVQLYLFGLQETPLLVAKETESAETPQEPDTAFSTPPTPKPSAQKQSASPTKESHPTASPQPEYESNVMDIDWENLIAMEDDANLKEMHTYFSNVPPTNQNEYTGMFEGYNLITVTAESFAPYAIDAQLTPTLYKMANEGFQFSNFYCPEWAVSTSDGEYVNSLGLIPKSGVWSLYVSGKNKNYLPFALGNQFLQQGYLTNAYHNNTYTYYNRDVSHPNLGYTYTGLGNGLEIDQTWPESDYQMIDVTTNLFMGQGKPFHTYYLTVSGHMMYDWDGNAMATKHKDLVDHLPLSENSKAYLACNIELDRAMELLLQRLNDLGIAEKTVIAISPDHPPYGLQKEEISELIGHDVEQTFEYAKSTFILYNQGMQPQVVEKPCCSLDILPTLSNLFGIPYDSRLLMGHDIFSNSTPLVILGDRSWLTDKASFNANTGEVDMFENVDDAYIDDINKEIADKFAFSSQMLDADYYRKVLE